MPNKLTKKEFIERGNKIHCNIYEYSNIIYVNIKTKINIVCYKHGEFKQTPDSHLRGRGCPKCANKNITTEEFIFKSKIIHNNKYGYSKSTYKKSNNKIIIICNEHGQFKQKPNDHLNGQGCPICGIISNKLTTEEFIFKSKIIHNNKYDYTISKYLGSNQNIEIICPNHGNFNQIARTHIQGSGCPICKESKGEKEIKKYLEDNNIDYKREKKFYDCKGVKRLLPFDFYLSNQNILIEYDGRQHFEPVNFFGISNEKAINRFILTQKNDKIKNKYCEENNIDLYRISYKEDVFSCLKVMGLL